MKQTIYLILIALVVSCSENEQKQNTSLDMEQLKEGRWLMNFQLTPEQQLPVFFDLTKTNKQIDVVFINGDEDDDGIQAFCDEHNVEKYPHIKIYNKDKLVFEDIDTINCPKMVFSILKEISYETESETNRSNKS